MVIKKQKEKIAKLRDELLQYAKEKLGKNSTPNEQAVYVRGLLRGYSQNEIEL